MPPTVLAIRHIVLPVLVLLIKIIQLRFKHIHSIYLLYVTSLSSAICQIGLFLSSMLPNSFSWARVRTCLYKISASLYFPWKQDILIDLLIISVKMKPHLFKIGGGQIVFSFRHIGIVLTQLALVDLQSSLVIPADYKHCYRPPYFLINHGQLICCSQFTAARTAGHL